MNQHRPQGDTVLIEISERVATLTLNRPQQYNALSRELRNEFTRALIELNADDDVDVIIVAAVNGLAVTGGFELAAQCDILVASSNARFADTHCRVGVVSAWGFTQTLTALIGPVRARYLSFTGNFIDAHMAKEWGLVLEVLPPDELMPYCR